jgi:hypothetical protein
MTPNAARFWSDHLIAETEKFGELITSSPQLLSGFLGGGAGEPFYRGGYSMAEECREFRVFQVHGPEGDFIVERNLEIQRAFLKSKMRVNGDTSDNDARWIQRISFADALDHLARHSKDNREALEAVVDCAAVSRGEARASTKQGFPNATLTKLAGTIGLSIVRAMESPDPTQAIKDLTSSFQLGLQALARSADLIDDKRLGRRPKVHELIESAEMIFLSRRERPTKLQVKEFLTSQKDRTIAGKNASATWTDLFLVSGLSDLPD